MRKVSIFLLVGLMLVGGLSVGVYAQNNNGGSASNNGATDGTVSDATVNTNATAQINTIVALYVHSGVSLGELTSDKYNFNSSGTWSELGELENINNTVKAFSNVTYTVEVEANHVSGDTYEDFDMGDLKFSNDNGSSWTAFSSTGNKLSVIDSDASGSGPDTKGFITKSVGYKYLPDASDTPGEYKATLTYTISTG